MPIWKSVAAKGRVDDRHRYGTVSACGMRHIWQKQKKHIRRTWFYLSGAGEFSSASKIKHALWLGRRPAKQLRQECTPACTHLPARATAAPGAATSATAKAGAPANNPRESGLTRCAQLQAFGRRIKHRLRLAAVPPVQRTTVRLVSSEVETTPLRASAA